MNDLHREILRLCILFVDTDTKWWGGGLERLDFDFFSHVSFVRVPVQGANCRHQQRIIGQRQLTHVHRADL